MATETEDEQEVDVDDAIEIIRRLKAITAEVKAEKRRKKLTSREEADEVTERYKKLYES